MTNKPGNKSAYPITTDVLYSNGLTKRELIAAMAMTAMIGNVNDFTMSESVERSVKAADALLAELEKTNEE